MNFRTNRLATRVTIIFFLAMAALLIVLATVFAWIIYDSQQTSTAALQRETAQRAAATIDAHLESLRAPIANAVQLRADLFQQTPNDQQRFLTNLLLQNPSYIDLALLDEQGQVIAAVARMGHRLENAERDADRAAAFQAAQSGQPYLSRVHLTTANREPYIVMSQPFDKSRGVLIVWMNLNHVWEITAQVQIGDSGYAYILDADGNLIAGRDVARVIARENPLHNNPKLRDLLRDPNAVNDYIGLNGETVLGAHAPIASTSWMIVVETPRREAYLILYRSLAFIAILLIISVLLAAGIAHYLAVRLLKPIDLLRHGVGLIAQGQLDHTIVIKTNDEIQELANEFNTMTASLRRARMENETWTRELGRRVEERTAQVIDQKQQLAVLEERQRIARELHDSITQTLFTLTITLESAQAFLKKDARRVPALIERAHTMGKTALAETRALIANLRPVALGQRSLVDALRDEFVALTARTGSPIDFQADDGNTLSPDCEDALYRITLEAVNNAVKHGHAKYIVVRLQTMDHKIKMIAQDDGVGFDTTAEYAGHFGLKMMRERARALGGDVSIESALGKSTIVRVEIPIQGNSGK
ncbi:MAG: HAMP domain-containing protein [Chloroflexi bacterium]|nr:HAMP domain-containing protein [Chloroflexota bacterium]